MNKKHYDYFMVGELDVIQAEMNIGKAKQSLMELHDQYNKQKESQDSFKEELKISKKDADELRARGYGEESIRKARYN